MSEQLLIVTELNQYGRERFEPVNEIAKAYCRLIKQKTFTLDDLLTIKALGRTILVEGKNERQV